MEMKERWQIEADIYLAEKQEQENGVWAYGEVTVDQLLTFQVRVLTCTKENGEKTSFVTYPSSSSSNPERDYKGSSSSRSNGAACDKTSGKERPDSSNSGSCNGGSFGTYRFRYYCKAG